MCYPQTLQFRPRSLKEQDDSLNDLSYSKIDKDRYITVPVDFGFEFCIVLKITLDSDLCLVQLCNSSGCLLVGTIVISTFGIDGLGNCQQCAFLHP